MKQWMDHDLKYNPDLRNHILKNLNPCLVVPIFNLNNKIMAIYVQNLDFMYFQLDY